MKYIRQLNNNKGSVSLFVVIFFCLLITVVVVGFVRIAIKDQQAATALDLSQSAYDSAQAGVEDAKRALIELNTICSSGGDCTGATSEIDSSDCNMSVKRVTGVNPTTDSEVKIKQSSGDTVSASLDQAYTCVVITRNTADFLGKLTADESKVIHLKGLSAFNKIQIEWYNSNDLPTGKTISYQTYPNLAGSLGAEYPPIIKAHLIQVASTFNSNNMNNTSTNSSLFLYPKNGSTSTSYSFTADAPQLPTKNPFVVNCQNLSATVAYACSAMLSLPDPLGGTSANRDAYLDLKALYNSANYRVTLWNDSTSVKFNNVQPQVDSTGRANSLFRRVQTRVELVDSFSYPTAAVETSGNFCKNMSVTDQTGDYSNSCTP